MKKLFCPWRTQYAGYTGQSKTEKTTMKECVFCNQFNQNNDNEFFILKRTKHTIVMLNRYPYNAGHLLIMPIKHIARLHVMEQEARTELMELTTHASQILEQTLDTHGINVGINLGKAAGAGIPSHLHMHVLPRWNGDTNFLPLLSETKQISFDLTEIFKQLKPEFEKI